MLPYFMFTNGMTHRFCLGGQGLEGLGELLNGAVVRDCAEVFSSCGVCGKDSNNCVSC